MENSDERADDVEARAKYTAEQLRELGEKGHAFKNADGSYSYPVDDLEDLHNAIRAVGRGNADHDAIRRYIIGRAKSLGASDQIPDVWSADGSLKRTQRRAKQRHRAIPLLPEIRHFRTTDLEVRSDGADDEQIVITGSPIIYGTPYTVTDAFGPFEERMQPGVARDVLDNDVRFLFNHDGLPLARSTSGTLELRDGPDALRFTARLDRRQAAANDLAIAIERGDVTQMSCGFVVARDEWDERQESRTIHRLAELLDVSAVTYPASSTTSIQIARRMALQAPIESRARIRSMFAEVRAGKTLSKANQDRLVEAVTNLHHVLDAAGFDPQDLIGREDHPTERDDRRIGSQQDLPSNDPDGDGWSDGPDGPEMEQRAEMSTAAINDLPDSAFAYIEPGGEKDSDGKTTPRDKRHYPIHDAAHMRDALARASAAIAAGGDTAEIARKALPKIRAAAKKFGVGQRSDALRLKVEAHRRAPVGA